jgi:hypothetical protein
MRPIEQIDADFRKLFDEFDAEMRRLGVFPSPEQGEQRLREFARVGNLTFYHCMHETISAVLVHLPSVRERCE